MQKYGIPLSDLPTHCLDAVDAAERSRARTLVMRNGQAVAAIVPMIDLDAVDPPDPGAGGADPLLALCGACRDDPFVDALLLEADLVEDFDPRATEEDLEPTNVSEDLRATRVADDLRTTLVGLPPPGGKRPPRPRS